MFLKLKPNSHKRSYSSRVSTLLVFIFETWLTAWFYYLLLVLSRDVQHNPGPKRSCNHAFPICQWGLNSISTHDCGRVFLLKACIAAHKFDTIFISETYLDFNTPSDNNILEISSYNFVCSDHHSKNKRGGVCIYLKKLILTLVNVQYLQESISFEIKIG